MKVTIQLNSSQKWEVLFNKEVIGVFDTLEEAKFEYSFAEIETKEKEISLFRVG